MTARKTRHFVRASIIPASALLLFLCASPIVSPAAGQSAGDDEIKTALLGLNDDFLETLYEVTPEMLAKQRALVETLSVHKAGAVEEEREGTVGAADVLTAKLRYLRELESLKVMELRSQDKSASAKDILKLRITVRAEALALLQEYGRFAEGLYASGVIRRTELALHEANTLKAEIVLEAMKKAAGQ